MRLVLRQHTEAEISRIDQVAQHEVDQSIGASERHRGLRPVRGQRIRDVCPRRRRARFQAHAAGSSPCQPIGAATPPPAKRRVTVSPIPECVRERWPEATRAVTFSAVRVAMMTKEYPPEIYGGAGVHVTELVAQLKRLCEVDVHCMGAPRDGAIVHTPDPALAGANPALDDAVRRIADGGRRDRCRRRALPHLVHRPGGPSGVRALYDVPHILTAHSLEPRTAVEGRTAGRRLPHLVVVRTQRRRARRRGDRRQRRDATRRPRRVPVRRPAPGPRGAQRDRHVGLASRDPQVRETPPSRRSASTRASRWWRSSVGSPGRRASVISSPPHTTSSPTSSSCCARALPTPRRSPPRPRQAVAALAAHRGQRVLGAGNAPDRADAGDPLGRNRLRVPVRVRAPGDREPRGHGLRDRCRRVRCRRYPRGGRRRGHRPSGALQLVRARGVRTGAGRAGQRDRRRRRDGRRDGQGRASAGDRRVLLGGHRTADARRLPGRASRR